jgi:hypothetical protein
MQERLQAQLAALGKGVQAAAMSEGCRQTAAWCVGRLPGLYSKFQQTNESRYGDEITRIVQALLNELSDSEKTRPGGRQLADQITDQFRLLHETFGLPRLHLRLRAAATSRPRTAR